jgi:hypothetical protein
MVVDDLLDPAVAAGSGVSECCRAGLPVGRRAVSCAARVYGCLSRGRGVEGNSTRELLPAAPVTAAAWWPLRVERDVADLAAVARAGPHLAVDDDTAAESGADGDDENGSGAYLWR